jgi:hypothetical protein
VKSSVPSAARSGLDAYSVWGILTEKNRGGPVPGANGAGQESTPRRVVLLSNERDLRSLFERALGTSECLVVAGGDEEMRQALATPAATVVISVQVSDRIATWQRVRELHSGMVLVAIDNEEQTHGWPPDVARRFLVRPFGVEEIVAMLTVRPRILREPAAARRRRLAKAQNPPVVPLPALPPPPDTAVEPLRRLETGESLWDALPPPDEADAADGGAEPAPADRAAQAPAQRESPAPRDAKPERPATAAAKPERATAASPASKLARGTATTTRERAKTNGTMPAPAAPRREELAAPAAERPDRRRVGLLVGVMALLLVATSVGGVVIGRATAPDRPAPPGPATPSTATPGVVPKEKAPAACEAALADADAAVSYLVGNVRDDRLSQALQSYQQNRKACRAASR